MLLRALDESSAAAIRRRLARIFTQDIPEALGDGTQLQRDCADDGACTPEIDFGTTLTVAEELRAYGVLETLRSQTTVGVFISMV